MTKEKKPLCDLCELERSPPEADKRVVKKIIYSNTMSNILQKLPVKNTNGSIDLIEIDSIFYLEASSGDTLIRTKRKKPYRSVQRLHELAKKLPKPPFEQCHREFIVNLNRVRAITPRKTQDYDLRLDPPVNRRIPISRKRLANIHKIIGL